ncbi:F-box domain-containing protein [Heracleum sosnowskyi]|uniref:F-box domain-containing protein n=1 Tax=Heracleum sosnowskyi TaxID=360622 RepID=A0AAD8IC99_9APIA|nr:F-box domain-containing protein [Heracleum sosnowskyi]
MSELSIHGCCNGLIFYTSRGFVFLWNPTIKKLKALPSRIHYGDAYGFWFDKRVNDYMVAKIYGEFCDVYSLSTNSWRNVSAEVPDHIIGEVAYVDGTLHWLANNRSGWMICSLNIESGMLRKTMITERWYKFFNLEPLGEHSFAVVESTNDARRCCKVQVYDENVNNLYTVDLEKETQHKLHYTAGLRNNGEALFTKFDLADSGIISWNTKTKDIKEFIPGVTVTEALDGSHPLANHMLSRARPFVETLVLLNDGYKESDHSTYKQVIWFIIICLVFLGIVLL